MSLSPTTVKMVKNQLHGELRAIFKFWSFCAVKICKQCLQTASALPPDFFPGLRPWTQLGEFRSPDPLVYSTPPPNEYTGRWLCSDRTSREIRDGWQPQCFDILDRCRMLPLQAEDMTRWRLVSATAVWTALSRQKQVSVIVNYQNIRSASISYTSRLAETGCCRQKLNHGCDTSANQRHCSDGTVAGKVLTNVTKKRSIWLLPSPAMNIIRLIRLLACQSLQTDWICPTF